MKNKNLSGLSEKELLDLPPTETAGWISWYIGCVICGDVRKSFNYWFKKWFSPKFRVDAHEPSIDKVNETFIRVETPNGNMFFGIYVRPIKDEKVIEQHFGPYERSEKFYFKPKE